MKILNTIKKHIASLFNANKPLSISAIKALEPIVEEEYSKDDGPTNINIPDIHFLRSLEPDFLDDPKPFDPTYLYKEDLDGILKGLFSSNNISRLEKRRVLLHIYMDCLELHKAILPLFELNIRYSIDLVGGAPRDFLLDNHKNIKDLDILVTMTHGSNLIDSYLASQIHNEHLNEQKILEKNWCSKEELEKVEFSDNDLLYTKHNKLLQLCLNRNHQLTSTKIFTKDERKTGEVIYGTDILKELSGIVKVESPTLHYPMEILLSDQPRYVFYKAIDFGICNVGLKIINLVRDEYLELVSFDNIVHNFTASIDFFKDVKNKTITYNTYNKSFDQIEYSFNNHLKRIEEKYPDYKLQVDYANIDPETKKHIDTVMMVNNLTEELEVKEEVKVKPRRSKI
jgi:hypothetical protein